MNYSIQASKRLVTFTMDASPTQEEFREFLDLVISDPLFERGFAFLGDCRRCATELDPSFARMMASQLRANADHLAPCKWAFVFQSGWGFAATRVCSLLTYDMGLEFSAFLKPDEADKWLGGEGSGLAEIANPPRPVDSHLTYLLDLRRRPGSGLHPRVLRKVS
jgi:hypothetical protein